MCGNCFGEGGLALREVWGRPWSGAKSHDVHAKTGKAVAQCSMMAVS